MVSRASHSACRLAPLGTEERTGGRGGCCCLGCLSWVGRRAMGKTRTGPRCGIRYEYDKTFSSTNKILGRATHTPSSQWHSQVSCHGARTTRLRTYQTYAAASPAAGGPGISRCVLGDQSVLLATNRTVLRPRAALYTPTRIRPILATQPGGPAVEDPCYG